MARARPLGDGRVVLALTRNEADALWRLLYNTVALGDTLDSRAWAAVERVQKVLGAARSSTEGRGHGEA